MKTLEEAASLIKSDSKYWERNADLIEQVSKNGDVMQCLFLIATMDQPLAIKLLQSLAVGLSIGIEMEKQ